MDRLTRGWSPPDLRRDRRPLDGVRFRRPPAREPRLATMRAAERRRNRALRHAELTPHLQADPAATQTAEEQLLATLTRALLLSVAAWLLIDIVLPVLLQLAGAPFD